MKANDQIEYAYKECLDPIPSDSAMEIASMKKEFKTEVSQS